MGLPGRGKAKRGEVVTLPDGRKVTVRGLTRREVVAISDIPPGPDRNHQVEIHLLAYGTDTPVDEAAAWYEDEDNATVDPLVKAINARSGLGDTGKASGGD